MVGVRGVCGVCAQSVFERRRAFKGSLRLVEAVRQGDGGSRRVRGWG